MNSYTRLPIEAVKQILPNFEGEDKWYRLLPRSWFEKSKTQKLLGCREWWYSLGGSDCGKFTLRLLADIAERFSEKYCLWGSSGGGGLDGGADSSRYGNHSDAPLLGFCKYLRRDGKWHICGVTIIEEKPNMSYFFERTTTDIRRVYLNPEELSSIVYVRAF